MSSWHSVVRKWKDFFLKKSQRQKQNNVLETDRFKPVNYTEKDRRLCEMNVVVFGLKTIEDFSLCLLMSTVALRVHATYWAFLAYKSIRGKCLIHDIIIQQACHSCNTGNTNMGLVDILRPQRDAAGLCQEQSLNWKAKVETNSLLTRKLTKLAPKLIRGLWFLNNKQRSKQVNWN